MCWKCVTGIEGPSVDTGCRSCLLSHCDVTQLPTLRTLGQHLLGRQSSPTARMRPRPLVLHGDQSVLSVQLHQVDPQDLAFRPDHHDQVAHHDHLSLVWYKAALFGFWNVPSLPVSSPAKLAVGLQRKVKELSSEWLRSILCFKS